MSSEKNEESNNETEKEVVQSPSVKHFFQTAWNDFVSEIKDGITEFQQIFKAETQKNQESWEKIAKWMGADPKVLENTIKEYNSFCDKGHDKIFVKDKKHLKPLRTPPYHAIKTYSGYYNTIGGIKINQYMEVLDKQDRPIPGLYAAGVDTGGWSAETYNANLSGMTFSFALNSGRIAGENAADYALARAISAG